MPKKQAKLAIYDDMKNIMKQKKSPNMVPAPQFRPKKRTNKYTAAKGKTRA
jgi:hypothetical protein